MPINQIRLRRTAPNLGPDRHFTPPLDRHTGILYQIAVVNGNRTQFIGLLDLHLGKFGPINLAPVYPLLNGLG